MKIIIHCLSAFLLLLGFNTPVMSQGYRLGKNLQPWFDEHQLSLKPDQACKGAWSDQRLADWFAAQSHSPYWLSDMWSGKNSEARSWREKLFGYFEGGVKYGLGPKTPKPQADLEEIK